MRISKLALIASLLGAMVVGSLASAGAQDAPDATQTADEADGRWTMRRGPGKHAVRSQALLPPREEGGAFVTVRTDNGVLRSVDGSTLVVDEADGTTVEIVVSEDTALRRDGEEATVADLRAGDRIHAVRAREGDADLTTRRVVAVSEERYAEIESRREACRADRDACPRPGRGRGGPGGSPPDAPEADGQGAAAFPGRFGAV